MLTMNPVDPDHLPELFSRFEFAYDEHCFAVEAADNGAPLGFCLFEFVGGLCRILRLADAGDEMIQDAALADGLLKAALNVAHRRGYTVAVLSDECGTDAAQAETSFQIDDLLGGCGDS